MTTAKITAINTNNVPSMMSWPTTTSFRTPAPD